VFLAARLHSPLTNLSNSCLAWSRHTPHRSDLSLVPPSGIPRAHPMGPRVIQGECPTTNNPNAETRQPKRESIK
jgi:hypothetical protein